MALLIAKNPPPRREPSVVRVQGEWHDVGLDIGRALRRGRRDTLTQPSNNDNEADPSNGGDPYLLRLG